MPFGGKIINSCRLAHQTSKNFYLGYRFQNKNETLFPFNFASYMVIHTRKRRIMRSKGENVICKVENEEKMRSFGIVFSAVLAFALFLYSVFFCSFSPFLTAASSTVLICSKIKKIYT